MSKKANKTAKAAEYLRRIAQKKVQGYKHHARIVARFLHISEMTGKLSGIASLGTAINMNPICMARIAAGNSVCAHCYAAATTANYDSLREHLEHNTELLTKDLLTKEQIDNVVYQMEEMRYTELRIEAFADCMNRVQALNYIRIAYAVIEAGYKCAIWTKNPNFYDYAIKKLGKPAGLTMILSSCQLNTPDIRLREKYASWIDYVFTVYDSKESAAKAIACGAYECRCENGSCHKKSICNHCYSGKNKETHENGVIRDIAEILR